MINRTLIRLKTVQMLYSYLLTRHEFTVESEDLGEDFYGSEGYNDDEMDPEAFDEMTYDQ